MESPVIARSRRRRSNLFFGRDCFASLAMTPSSWLGNREIILSLVLIRRGTGRSDHGLPQSLLDGVLKNREPFLQHRLLDHQRRQNLDDVIVRAAEFDNQTALEG